ncbi:MAG: fumarylacetoacetate hydrolase family protein [Alphaproteobacteria bacterium]|nr:fumarylacetoacetate hydrolase family protein [Alphaproteobacteria bacterium]
MKLLRYGPPGREKPGMLDDTGAIRDLSAHVDDIAGDALGADVLARLAVLDPATLPAVGGHPRIGPCVGGVGKFIGIGLNYSDHAAETGMAEPAEPIVFTKHVSCICGPNDDVILPPGSEKADWEVELGVVIGRTARYVDEAQALDHVAGYCVVNDISERAYQFEGTGQWVKGKSCDTFGPIGPWLVTRDEIPDCQALDLWLDLNGARRQTGNTATMIFSALYIVSYLSRYFTLRPGDVICTGTPPGVGMGAKPQRFLRPGDEMRLGVEGLGEQRLNVIAYTND